MALPWLTVGKLVLGNLDTIISVVKPAFTKKKVEALPSQTDLLNQQIVELQAAASSNAGRREGHAKLGAMTALCPRGPERLFQCADERAE